MNYTYFNVLIILNFGMSYVNFNFCLNRIAMQIQCNYNVNTMQIQCKYNANIFLFSNLASNFDLD